jgi:hypothetical protein
MSRVPWPVLGGGEVETLLSNLIYNWNGKSLRIRPSKGDYGIDVTIPAPAKPDQWDVYQIKKFAQNLTANQKGQVEKSFGRALVGMLRKHVPLADWYLVMPLDPTLENLQEWFDGMPAEAIEALKANAELALTEDELGRIEAWRTAPERVIAWRGLDFCEKLAADYRFVVDYYLEGGSGRIKDAVAELAKLIKRDDQLRDADPGDEGELVDGDRGSALLEPGEMEDHLGRLGRVLNTDPHFRYGFGVSPTRPDLRPEEGIIAATQQEIPGDLWLTFKIYQRSAQSIDERPIPIELKFEFEEDSDEHQAFKDWIKYGKPAEAPATFKADLPGGLDRGSMSGRVSLPPQNESEAPYRLRFRVISPERSPLAEMSFLMRSTRGLDKTGGWIYGADDSGSIEVSMLIDGQVMGGSIKFTVAPIAGSVAARIAPALAFASEVVAPNVLQIAGELGPYEDFSPLPREEPLVEPAVERIVQALAVVQSRISDPVLVPEFHGNEYAVWQDIRRAASLIEGKTVVRTWTDYTFRKNADADMPVGSHWQMILGERLRLRSTTGEAELGLVEQHVGSVKIDSATGDQVRCVPFLDDTVHMIMVPSLPADTPQEFVVRCRRLPDPEDRASVAEQ